MDRPACNPKQPDLTKDKEMTLYLLQIEMERLETARRIERERNIVFPETSIILRDIEKLREHLMWHDRQSGLLR